MTQSAEKILDHAPLFRTPEYQEMLARKRELECMPPAAEVQQTDEWTKSWEYREKNFAREALTINPAKACQPLGAVFVAAGFEKTLSFVHGSQGCVAYYRSHLSRHFKEPCAAVSSSMTEDAAVFGGLQNMIDGLSNAYTLYSPKMIAVSTTCMAEVIGDDLQAFISTARDKGSVPADFDVPYAHTPAFVGSHTTGYDNMLKGILEHFWKKRERTPGTGLNVIGGFDGYAVANNRELKRILDLFGAEYTLLSDVSDQFDTPSDGEYRMYDGGTTIEATKDALNASATLSLQEWCTNKTLAYAESFGQKTAALHYPLGVGGTDDLLQAIAELDRQGSPGGTGEGARPPGRCARRQPGLSARQDLRDLRRSRLRLWHGALRAGDRRRAEALPGHQRQFGVGAADGGIVRHLAIRCGLQGLGRQGSVAFAFAAGHRAGGPAGRQFLRQVPGARLRRAAGAADLPDL